MVTWNKSVFLYKSVLLVFYYKKLFKEIFKKVKNIINYNFKHVTQ